MFNNIYINQETKRFVIIEDNFEKEQSLENLGYYLLSANSKTIKQAKKMMKQYYPDYSELRLKTIPLSLKSAKNFITDHHRHHHAPQGHKFSFGLSDGVNLVGVVVAGRPVSRNNDDGSTLEVTRLCVLDGFTNACSKLYSSVAQIAKIMGYTKVITYVLETELATSLKASGWTFELLTAGGSWNCNVRKRVDKSPLCKKQRWVKEFG